MKEAEFSKREKNKHAYVIHTVIIGHVVHYLRLIANFKEENLFKRQQNILSRI